MLAVEADGFEHHGTRRALRKDCRRHTELAVFGWSTLRFPFEDVMFQPAWTRWALRSWRVVRDGGVPDTPPLRMPDTDPGPGVSTATGSDTDRGASRARRNQPGRWHAPALPVGRTPAGTGERRTPQGRLGGRSAGRGRRPGSPRAAEDPRHPRAVGEERGRVVEGGQLLNSHDGRRQPHVPRRVTGEQVGSTRPGAVVRLGRRAPGVLAGRHPAARIHVS